MYIDDGGVVREIGSIFDDDCFKSLADHSNSPEHPATETEEHLSTVAAFSTGCIEIRALVEEEYSTYVRTRWNADKK